MINSSRMTEMVKAIMRRRQGVRDREVMDPNREWLLGIGVAITLVCLGGFLSYLLYANTISLEVAGAPTAAVTVPYNTTLIQGALEKFQERRATYEDLQGNSTTPITPPVTVPVVSEPVVAPDTVTNPESPSSEITSETSLDETPTLDF